MHKYVVEVDDKNNGPFMNVGAPRKVVYANNRAEAVELAENTKDSKVSVVWTDDIEDMRNGFGFVIGLVLLPICMCSWCLQSYKLIKAFRNGYNKPLNKQVYIPTPAEIAAQRERARNESIAEEKQRLKEHHEYWDPKIAEGKKNLRLLKIVTFIGFCLLATFLISGEIYARYYVKGYR